MASAYVLARVTLRGIDHPAQATGPLAEYFASAPASVTDFGGEFVIRDGKFQVLEGKDCFSRLIVVRFKNYDTALEWYNSDAYTRLRALRADGADMDIILIDGSI
jgi:uncharacterized protein (DUF1330 family)